MKPMESGEAERAPRRWRHLPRKLVAGVVVVVALAAGFLFWGNTESLSFPTFFHADPVSPGGVAVVRIDEGHCTAPLFVLERKSLFGRWQQTHVGQNRDVRQWWQISTRTLNSNMPCHIGPLEVVIPADITWSPVAVCDIDSSCVLIQVDLDGRG